MEVSVVEAVFIYANAFLYMLFHLQVFVDDEGTARLDEFCIMAEALQVGFLCAIDVKMVGVGSCNDAHPGTKPVETAVELISLDDYIVALVGQDVVGSIVL